LHFKGHKVSGSTSSKRREQADQSSNRRNWQCRKESCWTPQSSSNQTLHTCNLQATSTSGIRQAGAIRERVRFNGRVDLWKGETT